MAAVDFVQIALEESPLTETTWDAAATPHRISTDLLYPPARTARVAPTPQHLSRADELRGIPGEVPLLIDGYEPVGVLTTRAYGDLLPHLFALAGWEMTPTPGDGIIVDPDAVAIPAGATRWVGTKRTTIDAQTARVRTNYATENVLLEGYGFGISSLGLTASAELSADLMGLFLRRLAADAVTVPAVQSSQIQPFRRGDLFVSALAGGGRLADFGVTFTNPLERIPGFDQDPASDWPSALEHGDDHPTVGGTIPKRILTPADMDALIDATTFEMTARWIGRSNVGATARKYGLWLEMPAVQLVSGEPDELQNRRRHGLTLDWRAMWDETAGYDARITIVNGVSSILTLP